MYELVGVSSRGPKNHLTKWGNPDYTLGWTWDYEPCIPITHVPVRVSSVDPRWNLAAGGRAGFRPGVVVLGVSLLPRLVIPDDVKVVPW